MAGHVAYDRLILADVEAIAAVWIPRLGLQAWHIEFSEAMMKPKTTSMRCYRYASYDRAHIKVASWLLKNEPPKGWQGGRKATMWDVEETVVHELLHCHLMQLDRWQKHLHGSSNEHAWAATVLYHDEAEEAIVDRLARALTTAFRPDTVAP